MDRDVTNFVVNMFEIQIYCPFSCPEHREVNQPLFQWNRVPRESVSWTSYWLSILKRHSKKFGCEMEIKSWLSAGISWTSLPVFAHTTQAALSIPARLECKETLGLWPEVTGLISPWFEQTLHSYYRKNEQTTIVLCSQAVSVGYELLSYLVNIAEVCPVIEP